MWPTVAVARRGAVATAGLSRRRLSRRLSPAWLLVWSWLNPHVKMLADGTLVLHHDDTPDRTTNATGSVLISSYTTAAWKKLKVTPQNTTLWPGYGVDWGELHPPLFSEFLSRFGGRAALFIESTRLGWQSSGTVMQAIVDALTACGLEKTAVLFSFSAAEVAPAAAAGFETLFAPPDYPNTGSDAASILSAMSSVGGWASGKPKHVGINAYPTGATQAQVVTYIQSLVAAGMTVWAYGVSRRYEVSWLTAAGAVAIISDEPVYTASAARTNKAMVDQLQFGAWPHGLLQADQSRGRGNLANSGLKLDYTAANGNQFCVYGSFSPLPNLTTYTLQADFVWDTLDTDATRYPMLVIASPDDRATSMVIGTGNGVVDGYSFLFRQNASSLTISKCSQSAQTITSLLTPTTGLPPAATAGTVTTFKLQVTSTQITVSLIQGGTTYGPWTVTDSAYRGGYFHLGKSMGSTLPRLIGTWKNITVT